MPGGLGTLDELFEAYTLIQTDKIARFPIVLYGSEYWKGLLDWIKETVMTKEQNVSPQDLDLISIVDTPEEAVAIIDNFYEKYKHMLMPNF
jgi:predicted Rossmann-fold nucleotide-binding protein